MDCSIIIETYNVHEGSSVAGMRRALDLASQVRIPDGGVEVLLADVTGDPAVRGIAQEEFPEVRLLDAKGLGYSELKRRAAQEARGRYVVYLDSDCVPDPGWVERITEPLRAGSAVAVGGFTHYPGGFFTKLQSMLDFGFLFPREERVLGCYASNNSAFLREVLLDVPEPDGPMRCRCYAHAQDLMRAGHAPRLVPEVSVAHEAPPVLRERLRQGYDMIAACWVDRSLPEARWLKYRVFALPLYYGRRVRLDFRALRHHRRDTGLSRLGAAFALPLIPLWRLVDAVGMLGALALGPSARRWIEGVR